MKAKRLFLKIRIFKFLFLFFRARAELLLSAYVSSI